jgi:hypothetical protein
MLHTSHSQDEFIIPLKDSNVHHVSGVYYMLLVGAYVPYKKYSIVARKVYNSRYYFPGKLISIFATEHSLFFHL